MQAGSGATTLGTPSSPGVTGAIWVLVTVRVAIPGGVSDVGARLTVRLMDGLVGVRPHVPARE